MNDLSGATVIEVAKTDAPWGKKLTVQALSFESGLSMVRLRIREGHRFTDLDLDAAAVAWLTATLARGLDMARADSTAGDLGKTKPDHDTATD